MHKPNKSDLQLIRSSGLFDDDWYLDQYPDVRKLQLDPVEHYVWIGAELNRNPSPKFHTSSYFARYPHLRSAGALNPLVHFLRNRKDAKDDKDKSGDRLPARPPDFPIDPNSSTYGLQRPYTFLSRERMQEIAASYAARGNERKAIAVFTSITNDYDAALLHEHLLDDADYFLFSEAAEPHYVFKPVRQPLFDIDPVRSARFVKTHPHLLLPDYRVVIWVDGNVLIRGDLTDLIESFERSGHPVGAVPHPLRASVYEEAEECVKRGKDEYDLIHEQMERYRSRGFDCSDLVESNFMMFRPDHPLLAPFLNAWWAEIEGGSRRDQLSFNFAMRKSGASWFRLSEKPNSVRNHPSLALFHHGTHKPPYEIAAVLPAPHEPSYAEAKAERLARVAAKTADIVVCVHNALDVVKPCLQSVHDNRQPDLHRIVIVDDGSGAETADWLKSFAQTHPNVHLIRHEEALGYTKAANAGLRALQADISVLLNSDTVVAGPWVEKLIDAAFSNPGVGIVGPLSSAASHQSIPNHKSTSTQTATNDLPPGYSIADMNAWCEQNSPAGFLPRVPLVHGFCFAVTADAIRDVGYLDEENFPFGYGEENDYCFRVANAGFSLAIATHTYVYHIKSQSYQNERRQMLVKAGNQKIRDLHTRSRVIRAVKSMQENPHLVRLRQLSEKLFPAGQETPNVR